MTVLVLFEPRCELTPSSLNTLTAAGRVARRLGTELHAVWPGKRVEEQAACLSGLGIDRLHGVQGKNLPEFNHEFWVPFLAGLAGTLQSRLIVAPASVLGKAWCAALAARLGAELAQDCTALDVSADGLPRVEKPTFAGRIVAGLRLTESPALVTLRADAAPLERRGTETPQIQYHSPPALTGKCVLRDVVRSAGDRVDLAEARIIVAGGRGLGGPENWPLLQELCDVLGAALGASRAVVDAGWIDQAHQVGQTGRTVSPDLYIACGISGTIQHLAGMRRAGNVVAINKDPSAEIFRHCDYGLVGDLREVVPTLTRELKARRQHVA